MVEYIFLHDWAIWAIFALVSFILEMSSGDFYVTCCGIGSLCALVASFFVPMWGQVIVFAVFSVISIFLLRPLLLAWLNAKCDNRASNADAIIGRTGFVSETIVAGGYGRVKLDGDDWKAETDLTDDLPIGTKVRIVGRNSLIVKVERV